MKEKIVCQQNARLAKLVKRKQLYMIGQGTIIEGEG
jgi:hypothetical protein